RPQDFFSAARSWSCTACAAAAKWRIPAPGHAPGSGLPDAPVRRKPIPPGSHMTEQIIGGGAKKILYTLKTVRRMGLLNSAKALNSGNACKACGLGMGGQRGGMTDEQGAFPSVC